jgi:deoxyribodipyrimidine photolyase-related protein
LRTGSRACPFTTFYWDFLIRNISTFRSNRRVSMMLRYVDRIAGAERSAISAEAGRLRRKLGIQGAVSPTGR